MDVTAKIAKFVAQTDYASIPPAAMRTAKTAVLDCLGVALAGSKDESAKICAQLARQEGAREEAAVFGQGFRSSALQAAFANGTAAHALDYDHSFTLMGQPTAPIIPALFALGDFLGATGCELLTAYAVGFEVTGKLVYSLRHSSEDRWHGPGTLGTFGASAACAKLLRLNASQVEMALGISASMASGLVCNFGTMTKPLHVGRAARDGLLAAKLAQAGFTASAQAIEADTGLSAVLYRIEPDDSPIDELGNTFELERSGIKIKPYPCGGLTHAAIDAILELRAKQGITAEMIEAIDVDVTKHIFDRIVFRVPQTGLQGKFCMPYLLARALSDGKVSLEAFTDSAVRDRTILNLAEKITLRFDPDLKAVDEGSRPCRVTVRLTNGQTYTREVQHSKGGREVPLSQDELKAKFTECARQALNESDTERALECVERLETLDDIRPLCQILMG